MSEKKKSTYERNRIILKSFLSNIKNYIMLFSCFVLCVSVIFTFISTYQMSAKLQNIRLFNYTIGIGEIVYDAAMLMGALTILLTVFSIRHYERSRVSDYEIFRTLGMPWNFARLLKGIEYVGGMILSLLVGLILGNLFSFLLGKCILHYFPKTVLAGPDVLTYVLTILICSLIFFFCIAITDEVFTETNFLNDSEVPEKWPKKRRAKIFLCVGILLMAKEIFRYVQEGSENISILFWFLAGVAFFLYYGGSLLLGRIRKHEKNYIKHLLCRQRIFYQFWSNSLYIILFLGLWFMILFYYPMQILTTETTATKEEMYPYDYIWKMNADDERDTAFLSQLTEKYDADCTVTPMIMVTTPCMDRQAKADTPKPYRQGQHIGISASAYEKLTGDKVDLDKEELLVLLQQGKEEPGHPLDFYERNRTYLHFGPASLLVDFYDTENYFTDRYHVKELRNDNLIGIYGNGTNENIVVFSDETFEEVSKKKDVTELIRYQTGGEQSEFDEIFYGEEAEVVGVKNRLVLINVPEDKKREVSNLFKEQYADGISEKLYNPSVALYYDSDTSYTNLISERLMKNLIHLILYGIFIFILLYLSCIKVYTEQESIVNEDAFYRILGLSRKEREKIWFKRLTGSFCFPFIIAVLLSVIFTAITVQTRMLTLQNTLAFLKEYVWIFVTAVFVQTGICVLAKQYLRHRIKGKEDRRKKE